MQRLYKVPTELLIELVQSPLPNTLLVMCGTVPLGALVMGQGTRTYVVAEPAPGSDGVGDTDSIEGGTEEIRIEWALKRLLEMLNEQGAARAIEQGLSLPKSAGFFERSGRIET